MSNQRNRLNPHDTAVRRTKMLDLVRQGTHTWEHIANQCGYSDRGAACKDYHRILQAREEEVAAGIDDRRRAHLEGLMELRRVAVEVMRRDHVHVSGGRVVRESIIDEESGDERTGDPLMDDGPTLAAIDRVAKIDAQIAQLLGLNAPTRVEAEGSLEVRVVGVDVEDLT